MSVTLSWKVPEIFTSDNPNILLMSSTEQNTPNFYFKVQVFIGSTLVGFDRVFKGLSSVTEFDVSIYTRYLVDVNDKVTFTVRVTEVVGTTDGANSNITKRLIKGWVNDYDTSLIHTKGRSFLTDFRSFKFDENLLKTLYFAIFSRFDFRGRVVSYNSAGAVISDLTGAVQTADVALLNQSFTITDPTIRRVEISIIDESTADIYDTVVFNAIEDCSNVVLKWLNKYASIETMPLTHNTISNSNINAFDFEGENGKQDYLKTWRNGGVIYTQDLSDYEQTQIQSMLKSPFIELIYKDNTVTRTRRIKVSNRSWELNQQYFEDTKSEAINFEFIELEKSILL